MSTDGSASSTPVKFVFESTFYPEIGPDNRIPSKAFLEACHVVVDFLGSLGRIFRPIRTDISGHITRVKKLVASDPTTFAYLDAIIDPAVPVDNRHKRLRQDGITSLTWLKRSCEFILHFLTNFTHPNNMDQEDLKPLFREAYELKLKMHHNIIGQKLFQVCVHAAPSRSSMISVLTGKGDRSVEQVYSIISMFLVSMRANVECLVDTFDRFGRQQ